MNILSLNLKRKSFKAMSTFGYKNSACFSFNFYDVQFSTNADFKRNNEQIKAFRVMDEEGKILNKKYENIEKEKLLKIFKAMVTNSEADKIFNMAQRQNRISFYMTANGEEASVVGAAAGIEDHDFIYPQYREVGALIYRGYTVKNMANQLRGNYLDKGKGRQMPVHYGSNTLNYATVSSPLATQIPQASGSGYTYRIKGENRVALTFFGDGASSEGDFHTALNFAATLRCQTLFFCRNNMFAISTPVDEQFAGDGIAARSIGYGINTIRVDGHDLFAVYNAVKMAREYIVKEKAPALVEAISYRGGDHSTSDFSKLYRNETEMKKLEKLLKKLNDPIGRLKNYLEDKKWIEKNYIDQVKEQLTKEITDALKEATAQPFPSVDELFNDVYHEIPQHIKEQKESLHKHLEQHGQHYNLSQFKN